VTGEDRRTAGRGGRVGAIGEEWKDMGSPNYRHSTI
jgi:hypothetical protein